MWSLCYSAHVLSHVILSFVCFVTTDNFLHLSSFFLLFISPSAHSLSHRIFFIASFSLLPSLPHLLIISQSFSFPPFLTLSSLSLSYPPFLTLHSLSLSPLPFLVEEFSGRSCRPNSHSEFARQLLCKEKV